MRWDDRENRTQTGYRGSFVLLGFPLRLDRFHRFKESVRRPKRLECAAGTTQGKITVWDQAHPDGPKQIKFPHGSLNDLHFSPDEHVLAIASEYLGIYTPEASTAPGARPTSNLVLGPDGASIIFGTADGIIESWDVRTEKRLRSIKSPEA